MAKFQALYETPTGKKTIPIECADLPLAEELARLEAATNGWDVVVVEPEITISTPEDLSRR
jgi:hypothetical protein